MLLLIDSQLILRLDQGGGPAINQRLLAYQHFTLHGLLRKLDHAIGWLRGSHRLMQVMVLMLLKRSSLWLDTRVTATIIAHSSSFDPT